MMLVNPNGTFRPALFQVALSSLTEDTSFQLTSVKLNRATDETGKITDVVKSITYTVYVPDLLAQINIKVNSTTPVITPDQLDAQIAAGTDIFIEFPTAETFIKPYAMSYGAFSCTITAPSAKLA